MVVFFFNDTATTEIYTLSLHDALPIFDKEIELLSLVLRSRPAGMRVINHSMTAVQFDPAKWQQANQYTACGPAAAEDRKSTRLNSSHANISYAVFCLKKKK